MPAVTSVTAADSLERPAVALICNGPISVLGLFPRSHGDGAGCKQPLHDIFAFWHNPGLPIRNET